MSNIVIAGPTRNPWFNRLLSQCHEVARGWMAGQARHDGIVVSI